MCTQARIPSGSRRNESASSKSFAVSGSIVKVVSSRRSTRPSRLGAGGSCGSKSTRAPFSTSSPRARSRSATRARARARPGRARGPCGRRRGRRARRSRGGLSVEDDRHARREVRLAVDQLAAPADLDDEEVRQRRPGCQTCRKRRRVSPEPIAPRPSPIPSGSAPSSETRAHARRGRSRERGAGSTAARSPCRARGRTRRAPSRRGRRAGPSSMNGPRTNQFVAPTSFITSISRRREKIDSRIVFAISSVEATSSTTRRDGEHRLDHVRDLEDPVRGLLARR